MKVQFMKKLVPLALITSIAVTNVGITSVAAQTPTNAITQSVEGPVAVENESLSVGAGETTTAESVEATAKEVIAMSAGTYTDENTAVSNLDDNPVTGIDGSDGFKFYYDYGKDKESINNDDVAVASYNLKFNNANVKASKFLGKEGSFELVKTADSSAVTGVTINVSEIKAGEGATPTYPYGGLKFSFTAKKSALDFGNATGWTLKVKTSGESAAILKLVANATATERTPKNYEENAKGEVVKYYIKETAAGYGLYAQTITTDNAGNKTYAPADTGSNLESKISNTALIAVLTADQVNKLPYTTAKAATKEEYTKLENATDSIEGGQTKQYFTDHFANDTKTKVKEDLKAVYDAYTDDATDEDALEVIDAIIANLPETEAGQLKAAAKTAVVTYAGAGESNSDAVATAMVLARKKELFKEAKAGTLAMATTYLSGANMSTGEESISGDDATILKTVAADKTETEFIEWLEADNDGFAATAKPWNKIKTAAEVNALAWETQSDVATYMTDEARKIIVAELNAADYTTTTYTSKSTYVTGQMTTDAETYLLANEYAHKKQLDTASINWITETVNAKGDLASGAAFAKFAVTKNDKTSFAAKTTGDSVIVGATKANKQTNSYVIVKAVSKNYKAATAKTAQKGDVYAQAEFYVTPVASTGFTEKSLSTTAEKPGIKFEAPTATAAKTDAEDKTYKLSLDEGKSFKLPFALKDGADKTLVYDVTNTSKGFTVVNGTVKAIAGGGSGVITVYPKASGDNWTDEITGATDEAELTEATTLKIEVTTNSAIKTVKATSNNVTMYPGAEQWITFSSNPATDPAGLKYEITGLDKYTTAWVAKVGDTDTNAVTVNDGTTVGNVLYIKAPSANDIKTDETKTPDKTTKATVKLAKKWDASLATPAQVDVDVKDFTLNVKWAGAGANAKTVKETYKKVNSDGVVEINVPVGGVVNLGASVNPATADQSIYYVATKDVNGANGLNAIKSVKNGASATAAEATVTDGTNDTTDYTANKIAASPNEEIVMNGDVLKAVKAGTYYVKGWTAAKNEKGDNLTTNIYKINVYTPGASIIMNDQRDNVLYDNDGANTAADTTGATVLTKDKVYTIVGGNLMTKAAAETDGNKTIMGGQTIEIAEPYTLGTSEEIDWKCNKPSAIRITRVKEGYHLADATEVTTATGPRDDDKVYSTLKLDLMQAGTFTITGTTKYTKQKFVFKVNVGADATVKRDQTPTCEKFYFDYNGTAVDLLNGGSPVTDGATKMKVKDTASVGFFTNKPGLNGTVKYEAVDKKVLNVAANGTVKALAKGSTAIKATFTSADKKTTFTVTSPKITVEPQTATISKFTIPSGVSIGKDFNVSAAIKDAKIADCNVTWEYGKITSGELASSFDVTDPKDSNNDAITMSAWSLGNKPSGKVKLADDGTYLVRLKVAPKTDATAANTVYEYGIVEAFEKTPTIVNVNNNDADAKKAIAALAAAPKADPDNENGTIGGAGYGVYIIPVFATDKDNSTIDPGDIEWTSSNVSLATAEALVPDSGVSTKTWKDINVKTYLDSANASTNTTGSNNNHTAGQNSFADAVEEENAIVKSANNAYGLVKIVTAAKDSGLTGKVTLTGVLKNSGKKVTVTLNIKNEEKSVTDKYNPIGVTKGSDSSALTASNGFQNIVALKGDEYDKNAVNKLKKGATYTYYAYALVDTTDAKLLKAKPADHIKAINTAGADAQDMLVYTKADDKYNVSLIKKEAYANAANGDTYYLAQVAVSVKVKTAAVMNEAGDAVATDAVLETTPTKQVITIASQTPVIISAS